MSIKGIGGIHLSIEQKRGYMNRNENTGKTDSKYKISQNLIWWWIILNSSSPGTMWEAALLSFHTDWLKGFYEEKGAFWGTENYPYIKVW